MKNIIILLLIVLISINFSCSIKKKMEQSNKDTNVLSSDEIRKFFKLIKDSNYDEVKKIISENNAYVSMVDSSTFEYQSPLNVAIIRGYNNIAEVIIKSGANLNFKDVYGFTALHYCAKMNNIEIAKLLIENKADVNILNLSKEAPLHVAARYNHQEIVKLLLENKADKTLLNDSGKTPYDIARENNSIKVLELLK